MPRMAMLIDMTRCIGCDACTVACKQENGTPVDTFFARVLNIESGKYPNVKRMYVPVLCNHCDDAPCLKVCPNKAIIRREDGIVLIDQDRCKGTGACVSSCPYGNIYLSKEDRWYLDENEPYERDHIRPRLEQNVARKCTYCAHRVDEGLDPACVVACPTDARIFGDIEDPDSKISEYIVEQEEKTGRTPFHLLPQAGTEPAGMYLGPMSEQVSHTLGNRASSQGVEPLSHTSRLQEERNVRMQAEARPFLKRKLRSLPMTTMLLMLLLPVLLFAKEAGTRVMEPSAQSGFYTEAGCGVCHGEAGAGGYAPAVNNTKFTEAEFTAFVRDGMGAMTPYTVEELSDANLAGIYIEMSLAEVAEDEGEVVDPVEEETPAAEDDEDLIALAQGEGLREMEPSAGTDFYSTTDCVACHGQGGIGGFGPPIVKTKLTEEEFIAIVRNGVGRMPPTSTETMSDEDVARVYAELSDAEVAEGEVPIAFKVGQVLTTKSVTKIFLTVFVIAAIFGFWNLFYWLGLSGLRQLKPVIAKFGRGKALGIVGKALFVEGFLVSSLYKKDKFRWVMHGLMLYGFCGLILADILMQVLNPARGDLSSDQAWIKVLAVLCGAAVLLGVCYVFYRYKTDEYIDNGLTLGKDFLFVNLLLHTIVSGFLVVAIRSAGATEWLMAIYIYHLASIMILILAAPFTRFMHAWVVPAMIAMTRLTEAITESGVEIGYEREPSPGRHHKSQRIADQIVEQFDPEARDSVRLRYYP